MHLYPLPLPLASMFGLEPWIIGIVIPVAGLVFAGAIAISAMYFKNRQRELWHQTAQLALEKGQPLPPMPRSDEEAENQPPAGVDFAKWHEARRAESRRGELKGGLILIAVGVALFVFLGASVGRVAGGVVGGIGFALLVSVALDKFSSRRADTSGQRPQS